jgi:apolipoprotein N-acyltransferase
MSKFRSIEQGIPLLRAARTGVSAIVDSYGRVISKTELLQKTNLDGYLPNSLNYQTIYSKYGDSLILSIIALLLLYIYLTPNKIYTKK